MLRFAGSTRRGFGIPPSPHCSARRIALRPYRPGDVTIGGTPFEGHCPFLTCCGGELLAALVRTLLSIGPGRYANFLELCNGEVRRIPLLRTPVNRLHSCLFRALI